MTSGEKQPSEQLSKLMPSANELLQQCYRQGKMAFERGQYRQAVEALSQASALSEQGSALGGDVQIWLVTAYEAAGQRQEALNLCRQLTLHPHRETRQQSKRLLYILEAPQLKRPAEWLTQIPDLSNVQDIDPQARKGSGLSPTPRAQPVAPETPVDLTTVETRDNQFVWVALTAVALILGSLAWWGSH